MEMDVKNTYDEEIANSGNSMCCEDLGYSNFMDEIKICGLIFRKDQKE